MDGNTDLDREKNWVLLSLVKKEKSTIVKLTIFSSDTGTNFDNPVKHLYRVKICFLKY